MAVTLERVLVTLVNRSFTALWAVAAVIVLRLALRRAPKWVHCALWALVALRLLFSWNIASPLSVYNLADTPVSAGGEVEYVRYLDTDGGARAAFDASLLAPYASVEKDTDWTSDAATPVARLRDTAYLPPLAALWLAGAAAMLGYALLSYVRLRRRVAASIERGGVWLCDDVDTPFILGVLRPRVYLPSGMDEARRALVVAHERAHLARRDHWWKPLGFALLAAYWFNPALWLAYVLLCRDIELACDERVLRDLGAAAKKPYAEALLTCSAPRHMVSACPVAFGEVGVKQRVRAVLDWKKPAFWAVAVALAACAAAAVCLLTNPQTLRLELKREDILDVTAYHADTVEDAGLWQLNEKETDMLYRRLSAVEGARRGGYAGQTPLYTLTLRAAYADDLQIRGYKDDGTMTEAYYRDKTWRVENDEFGRYVMRLCASVPEAKPAPEPEPAAELIPFADIMGYDGYYVEDESVPWHYRRTYNYALDAGTGLLAESFGFQIDDYVLDLDGDGVTELICNCTYGDGADRVYVYRKNGDMIQRGWLDCFGRRELYPGISDTEAVWAIVQRYDAEQGAFLVTYPSRAASSGDGTTSGSFTRAVGYDAFTWEDYSRIPELAAADGRRFDPPAPLDPPTSQ